MATLGPRSDSLNPETSIQGQCVSHVQILPNDERRKALFSFVLRINGFVERSGNDQNHRQSAVCPDRTVAGHLRAEWMRKAFLHHG